MTYNTYQQLGVDGLRGLSNFNVDTGVSWHVFGEACGHVVTFTN